MRPEAGIFQPLTRSEGRRTAVEVHDTLRTLILTGKLKPGTVLSQVEVARELHVSRTPVREAMRMLQESGLLSNEPNYRSRVLGFDPDDVEALYMKRILLEALGVGLTARHGTAALFARLNEIIEALEGEGAHSSFVTWLGLHHELHGLLMSAAPEPYINDLRNLELRSARYQVAYRGQNATGWWQRGETEHRAIVEATIAGDAGKAAELAARHLARTALELLAALAPEHDTTKLRDTLRFVIASSRAL